MLLLALILLALPFITPYPSLATEMLIFAIFAMGYDILFGYTGLLSFGQAMFFGIGAYTTGLFLIKVYPSLTLGLMASVLIAEIAALVVGYLTLKRRGIYFVMLTLAFCQMFYFIAFKWTSLTGGDNGLHGVPRTRFGIVDFANESFLYLLVFCSFIILAVLAFRVVNSPFGKVIVSLKNNEERAQSIGYNTFRYKLASFMISAFYASIAGGLYAFHLNFVPLDCLSIWTSGEVVIMVLLGGPGTLYGPVFGAMLMVYLRNVLSNLFGCWSLIIGVLLIVSVLTARRGFIVLAKERVSAYFAKWGSHQ